jgi:hypothetical protein
VKTYEQFKTLCEDVGAGAVAVPGTPINHTGIAVAATGDDTSVIPVGKKRHRHRKKRPPILRRSAMDPHFDD